MILGLFDAIQSLNRSFFDDFYTFKWRFLDIVCGHRSPEK